MFSFLKRKSKKVNDNIFLLMTHPLDKKQGSFDLYDKVSITYSLKLQMVIILFEDKDGNIKGLKLKYENVLEIVDTPDKRLVCIFTKKYNFYIWFPNKEESHAFYLQTYSYLTIQKYVSLVEKEMGGGMAFLYSLPLKMRLPRM